MNPRTACTKTENICFLTIPWFLSFVHLLNIDFDIPLHFLSLLANTFCFLCQHGYSVYRNWGISFLIKVTGNNTGLVWSGGSGLAGQILVSISFLSYITLYASKRLISLARTHKNSWLAHPLCCFCPVLLVAVTFLLFGFTLALASYYLPILIPLVLLSSIILRYLVRYTTCLFLLRSYCSRFIVARSHLRFVLVSMYMHLWRENGEIEWWVEAKDGDMVGRACRVGGRLLACLLV